VYQLNINFLKAGFKKHGFKKKNPTQWAVLGFVGIFRRFFYFDVHSAVLDAIHIK